jgi:hypothetical protein
MSAEGLTQFDATKASDYKFVDRAGYLLLFSPTEVLATDELGMTMMRLNAGMESGVLSLGDTRLTAADSRQVARIIADTAEHQDYLELAEGDPELLAAFVNGYATAATELLPEFFPAAQAIWQANRPSRAFAGAHLLQQQDIQLQLLAGDVFVAGPAQIALTANPEFSRAAQLQAAFLQGAGNRFELVQSLFIAEKGMYNPIQEFLQNPGDVYDIQHALLYFIRGYMCTLSYANEGNEDKTLKFTETISRAITQDKRWGALTNSNLRDASLDWNSNWLKSMMNVMLDPESNPRAAQFLEDAHQFTSFGIMFNGAAGYANTFKYKPGQLDLPFWINQKRQEKVKAQLQDLDRVHSILKLVIDAHEDNQKAKANTPKHDPNAGSDLFSSLKNMSAAGIPGGVNEGDDPHEPSSDEEEWVDPFNLNLTAVDAVYEVTRHLIIHGRN